MLGIVIHAPKDLRVEEVAGQPLGPGDVRKSVSGPSALQELRRFQAGPVNHRNSNIRRLATRELGYERSLSRALRTVQQAHASPVS